MYYKYSNKNSIIVAYECGITPPVGKPITNKADHMAQGTKQDPWKLKTPPQTSEYEMYTDVKDGKEIIVCTVGKTVLHYDHRCLADLHAMLKQHGDWMELGSADEQKPAKDGTVEAWRRAGKCRTFSLRI